MNPEYFDVILLDMVGVPYSGLTPRYTGLGGSEFETLLLAESLAKKNLKVLILNKTGAISIEYGVTYYPITILDFRNFKCKNLIALRNSPIPYEKIDFDNVFIWTTDLPNNESFIHFANWCGKGRPGTLVCVSDWQKSMYPPEWNVKTIYNMLPDWVYDYKAEKNKNNYIYASAAMKGLPQTIEMWKEHKKNYFLKKANLSVCSPGYDSVDMDVMNKNKISFLGNLPFHDVVETIGKSGFMYYVNTHPETFCIVAALAEAVNTPVMGLCLANPGALPEVLTGPFLTNNQEEFTKNIMETAKNYPAQVNKKDYRISKILPQWLSLLKE